MVIHNSAKFRSSSGDIISANTLILPQMRDVASVIEYDCI